MMNSLVLKLIVLSCLIFQMGCEIQFKRKTTPATEKPAEMIEFEKLSSKEKEKQKVKKDTPKKDIQFGEKDSHIITLYYSNKANTIIRDDMIMQTKTSGKQEKNLVINAYIPRDVQVVPLPLKLERMLSSLPLNLLRVQVGNRVVIMNVKSRQILDIIKI